MKIVFNAVALLEFAICFGGGLLISIFLGVFGLSEGLHDAISLIIGEILIVLVLIVGDIIIRLYSVKKSNDKIYKILYPNRGGHIFFIPTFLFGIIILIM